LALVAHRQLAPLVELGLILYFQPLHLQAVAAVLLHFKTLLTEVREVGLLMLQVIRETEILQAHLHLKVITGPQEAAQI
jgi:hypothetical protein